uniref:Protein kinase domain-containing protein n=1 Tax=Chromera velia CCMP2878 TaxID=1169474 RepID=A0A0G4FY50_9ALVE|eukprot:Cvel_19354.t1-p1 / transcript=Cvel_19354.t1 / gene=Cvel_19354 / organism=Chromera_velia_CCMP2878 / gene_product=hypothetical protein / transcript_product=hypothetical protein / location=Cvel_scaffold1662:19040-20524(+) / protein_length=236 / sequence_SO=supercontig / SO=protein_coding / is_pseudo=false
MSAHDLALNNFSQPASQASSISNWPLDRGHFGSVFNHHKNFRFSLLNQYLYDTASVEASQKLANVLEGKDGHFNFCDHGLNGLFYEGRPMTPKRGTPFTTAPEVLSGSSDYGPMAELWSLGYLLYESSSEGDNHPLFEMSDKILSRDINPDLRAIRPDAIKQQPVTKDRLREKLPFDTIADGACHRELYHHFIDLLSKLLLMTDIIQHNEHNTDPTPITTNAFAIIPSNGPVTARV